MPHPFFEEMKFPAYRPEAIELHRVLCIAYDNPARVRNLYEQCAPDLPDLTQPASVNDLWHEALRNLAKAQPGLRKLCELAKSAYPRNQEIQSVIDAIEQSGTAKAVPQDFPAQPVAGESIRPLSKNILNVYPTPSPIFTGREKEKQQFKEAYEKSNLIAIVGLGGIGKTEYVSKCIEEFVSDKEKILWLDGKSESKFEVFVDSAGYGDVLKGENKTPLAVYSGFKSLIERDEKIIFLDNFQTVDAAFSDFIGFCKNLNKARIILITKSEPIIPEAQISIIYIEGLQEDAMPYARSIKDRNIQKHAHLEDKDLEAICESMEGHPLAIQLAMQLMHYGLSSKNIIEGISEFRGRKDVEALIKRLFTDMYNHPSTTAIEQELLQKFSVFKERVEHAAIAFIMDDRNILAPLSDLIDKLLIKYKNPYYETHPLIREFSNELLVNTQQTHAKAAEYYLNQRSSFLDIALEEEIFYHLSQSEQWDKTEEEIVGKGLAFIQLGQLNLVKNILETLKNNSRQNPVFDIFLGDIFQIWGDWESAKKYFNQAWQHNDNSKVKAEGMIKYGEILFRKGLAKEALPIFEKAYNFSKSIDSVKETARALNDMGLVDSFFGNSNDALDKFEEALKLRNTIKDYEGVAATITNIATEYSVQGDYDKSLKTYRKALQLQEKIGDKLGRSISLGNIGDVLHYKKKFSEALHMHTESLKMDEEVGNKLGLSTSISNIGMVLLAQGKVDEALEMYRRGVEIKREIGDNAGVSVTLAGIASAYFRKGQYDNALNTNFESLQIKEEIGSIPEIPDVLHNIGSIYVKKKLFDKALYYLFQTLAKSSQLQFRNNNTDTMNWIVEIRDEHLGLAKFKEMAGKVYEEMSDDLKVFIPLKELCKEPVVAVKKTGRNDPCPCGSGKKYKHCHGKAE